MKTIEFIAQNQDGFIKIPAKYNNALTKKFKVLITIEQQDTKPKSHKIARPKIPLISKDKKIQAAIEKNFKKYKPALKELATK